MRATRLITIVTALFSIPLFFTYQIKHTLFPQGYLFVFMFSAGLISVLIVPVLLLLEVIMVVVSTKRGELRIRLWHIGGTVIAGFAEGIFLVARNL